MVDVAVHAAVGEQACKVEPAAGRLGVRHELHQHGVFLELALLEGDVDAGHVLVDDAPCADIEVAYLGIAHEACRQADSAAGGGKGGAARHGEQAVDIGRGGKGGGVARAWLGKPVAIQDEEDGGHGIGNRGEGPILTAFGCAFGLFFRGDPGGVVPEGFKLEKRAGFCKENVDDNVVHVRQYPFAVLVAFHPQPLEIFGGGKVGKRVRQAARVPGGACRGDDDGVHAGVFAGEVNADNIQRLALFKPAHDNAGFGGGGKGGIAPGGLGGRRGLCL